jgi:hypothetical protein
MLKLNRSMARNTSDKIKFDVLVRAEASGETPDVSNIDRFRPEPEDVEKCRRWLTGKGVACYATEFGLACSASRQLFESLFSTQVEPLEQGPEKPPWRLHADPEPPAEIADYIEEVTLSVQPELF